MAIGIDLGGTRIKALAIDAAGGIHYLDNRPTNDQADGAWKQSVAELVASIQQESGGRRLPVGISAPGLPNNGNTAIAHMPGRLQGLEHFEWSGWLNTETRVVNDAVGALMAESRFGAARGKEHVVMLTLGTGVGGAILIDGKPYQGAFHKAGHIGHMVIDEHGDADVTGMPGSLEECIGNYTLGKRSGGRFQHTRDLLEALHNGDDQARDIWMLSVRRLALGLASVTNILSPEMIVLGGGITEAGAALFDPLEQFMAAYEWRAGGNRVQIVKATFGELAGAVGAGAYMLEEYAYEPD